LDAAKLSSAEVASELRKNRGGIFQNLLGRVKREKPSASKEKRSAFNIQSEENEEL